MKLYDQLTYSDPVAGTYGDCARACICTILQVDPQALPHPIAQDGGWNPKFMMALRGFGHRLAYKGVHDLDVDDMPRVVVAVGPTPRGNTRHGVVYDRIGYQVMHDPHPSRAGLTELVGYHYLTRYPA